MSNMLNKVKDAVTGDKHSHHPTSDNAGPHSSHDANTAQTHPVHGGLHGSTSAGIHSADPVNRSDPHVAPDLHHRNHPTSTRGSSNTGFGTSATGTTHDSAYAGPYSSKMANKADPRVDSDPNICYLPAPTVYDTSEEHGTSTGTGHRAGHRAEHSAGYGTSKTGGGHGTGTGHTSGHTQTSSHTPGSGTAPNTAGPHNSDLANKLDPRVDSNMDSSKTYGGNQTGR